MRNRLISFISVLIKQKLISFFLVSGLNTAFGYGLFAMFIYFGLTYTSALLISTIAGILFNFKTISRLVFKNNNNKLIFKFFEVYTITFLTNLGCLSIFKFYEVNLYLGGALLIIPVGIFAYILNKTLVFKDLKSE